MYPHSSLLKEIDESAKGAWNRSNHFCLCALLSDRKVHLKYSLVSADFMIFGACFNLASRNVLKQALDVS
jgi:hypothetical protein